MLRISGVVLCAAAAALAVRAVGEAGGFPVDLAATSATTSSASAPLGLTVTSPAQLRASDPLSFHLVVTNNTGRPCLLAPTDEGTVELTVSRDGTVLVPDFATVSTGEDLLPALAAQAVTVSPGENVAFSLPAEARTPATGGDGWQLRSVSPLAGGGGVAAVWPIGRPGRYTVTLSYAMPGGSGECRGATSVATAAFAIAPDCPPGAAGAAVPTSLGGAGLSLLLISMRRTRIRARIRTRPAFQTRRALVRCLVPALAATSAAIACPLSARAEVDFDRPGDTALTTAFANCKADYSKPGHDPEDVMDVINGTYRIVLRRSHDRGSETAGYGDHHAEITWNPTFHGQYSGGDVNADPCAALYHELVHAVDLAQNQRDPEMCDSTGIRRNEVRATRGENEYRAARGLPQRTKYGKDFLPSGTGASPSDILGDCDGPGDPLRDNSHDADDVHSAGGSNGDPHLTTFDDQRYDFQAVGEFVLAKADTGLEVQVRQSAFPDSRLVSVNSAVALRVGADRVVFTEDDGNVRTALNGQDAYFPDSGTTLPSGGTLRMDDAGQYVLRWPDGSEADIEPISIWGFRVLLYPAPALRGRLHGLLGNDDGDPANDLVTANGKVLPPNPGREQLYGAFADTWRVVDATSMLPYPPGTRTANFTDRSFPDRPVTVADLPAGPRAAAVTLCTSLGITDPAARDACVVDVVLTGRPAFAASASFTDQSIGSEIRSPGHPGSGPVKPGGTLHDGDTTAAAITTADQIDTYHLDLGTATIFRLADLVGESGASGRFTLQVALDGPSGVDSPGFTWTSNYQYRAVPGGKYTLKVSRADGDTGPYGFRLVTGKDRRKTLTVGQPMSGSIEVPGRVDLYSFRTTTQSTMKFLAGTGCDLTVAIVEDSPQPNAFSPAGLCSDPDFPKLDPNTDYLVAVWSEEQKTQAYSFTATLTPAP